jgi:copper chaperone
MQTTYRTPGITCEHCRMAIGREVSRVAGVTGVDVDLTAKQVTVTGAYDDDAVRTAIDDAGYDIAT